MYFLNFLLLLFTFFIPWGAESQELECPKSWVSYADNCYKFLRSPLKHRDGAFSSCQFYNAYLLNINTMEEHSFIMDWLRTNDPQHRTWYTSGVDMGNNVWRWQGDDTPFVNMDLAWLPGQRNMGGRFSVYNYSEISSRWGLMKVPGFQEFAYICEVPLRMSSIVISEERTYDYGAIYTDRRRIPRAPYFIREPTDVIYDMSGSPDRNEASLRCVAGGYPYPTYRWFKEGNELDPMSDVRFTQTDGTFTISKPEQLRDRGTYYCKATNQYGSVVSQSVQLNFGYIGQFNLKRSAEQGRENWGKAIFCDPPQHYPDINYYWSRDVIENFVDEDKRVFVSQDGNLYFSSLETVDRGVYSCNVQTRLPNPISTVGRTGPFFPLEVLPYSSNQQLQFPNNFPKVFPEAPVAGQDVRLECIAFGYPVASYNWTRKGASALPHGYSTTNYHRVLILPKVAVEDSGEYECEADNGRNSIKGVVTLSVQAKPIFTIPLQDMHADKGSTLVWNCEAFGNPDVRYEWLRNGDYLSRGIEPQDNVRYNIQNNILTIRNLDPKRDQGVYQCKATNQLGSAFSSAELRVLTLAPSFKKYPVKPITYVGETGNTTIQCNSEGAPTPRFQWKFNGRQMQGDQRIQILPNGNLILREARKSDEGTYSCTAQNEFGRAESEGRLVVIRRPNFVRRPANPIQSLVADIIRLECEAQVDEEIDLTYIWRVNGIRAEKYKHKRYLSGLEPGSLNVYNVSYFDEGEFECEVKTPMDSIYTSTKVFVRGPPGEVGGLRTVSTTDYSVRLIWTDGPYNGQQISSYDIEGRTHWNGTWVIVMKDFPIQNTRQQMPGGTRREVTIDRNLLSPWAQYEFRVVPRNIYGRGPASEASPYVTTREAKPYKAPDGVGGGGGNAGDLTITWTPLPPQDQNAPGVWYKVFYRMVDEGESDYRMVDTRNEGNVGLKVVSVGLHNYYTEYVVKVQAYNRAGQGPMSQEVTIFTAEDRPKATPSQISSRPFNSTALNVTWLPIDLSRESIRGELVGFRIKYWRRDIDDVKYATYQLSRSKENWALIVGLEPNTYYYVVAMAYNNAGSGPESEPFIDRTFKSAPLKAPTSVTLRAVTYTSVEATWRSSAPSYNEEPLAGFKIRYWESDQDFSTFKDVYVPLGGELIAQVYGLTPGKIYKLRILAWSQGGDGRMSSPVIEFQIVSPRGSAHKNRGVWQLPFVLSAFMVAFVYLWR